ncbi:GumC family protein [Haliovirga abyssi]|uniref:Polysaccharide chain length determinant N-terminal domain-containing protein n=1 Tax=Haliovirga abyssi TaxID=2996794 RepID=A0AAU9DBN0_9FUSO|nr:GNVR domain-containing protein [Haliovirga abyssi]BDU50680.1 hypothetical protein HLVA_12490 [Haliovirga abyssi]
MEENRQYVEEDEIDLLDLIKVIWKNKKLIIGITILITIIAAVVSIRMPKIYKSEMVFMAEQGDGSNGLSALASSIPFASMLGSSGGKSGINFITIMESRTFREDIVKNLKLYDYYIEKNEIDLSKLEEKDKPTITDIAEWLKNIVTVAQDDKSGTYTVDVELDDAEKSAEISNYYYTELERYIKEKNLTKAKRNREFIGKQLKLVEKKLKTQEEKLKNIEKKYNTVSIMDEAQALTEILTKLKTNVFELSGKLEVLKQFTGNENIEVKKLKKEISVYQGQITALEKGNKKLPIEMIALKDVPDIKIKMSRLQREVETTVSIYKMLLAQNETAKIDEVKENSVINILDPAITPKVPIKPNKKLNVIIGFVLGIFLGIFLAFFKEFIKGVDWNKIKED